MSDPLRYVFRGLTFDSDGDPVTKGLVARNPDADATIEEQVNFYRTRRATQFISTSKSLFPAAYYGTSRGTCSGTVVKIDLKLIREKTVYDISDAKNAIRHGFQIGTDLFNFAVRHGEVLIEGRIPRNAIVGKWCFKSKGPDRSLDDFMQGFGEQNLLQCAKMAYDVSVCHVESGVGSSKRMCHLTSHCPLAAGPLEHCTALPHGAFVCQKCLNGGPIAEEEEEEAAGSAPSTPQRHNSIRLGLADTTPPPPPRPRSSQAWYRTPTGKKYHVDQSCFGLRNASRVTPVTSRPGDLEPCKLCCR